MARGPRRKPLDFAGNPDRARYVTVEVRVGLWLEFVGRRDTHDTGYDLPGVRLTVTTVSGSAVLAEVCTLPSIIRSYY